MKDADIIEGVQRRATKIIPSLIKELIIRGKIGEVGYVFSKAHQAQG